MNNGFSTDNQAHGRRPWAPQGLPRRAVWVLIACLSVLLLAACGGAPPETEVSQVSRAGTPEATARPTGATPVETFTVAPTVTDTAQPPTSTSPPAPTDTPTATDTPEPTTPVVTPTESAAEETKQATVEADQSPTATVAEEPAEEGKSYELPFLGPSDAAVTIVEFGDYY